MNRVARPGQALSPGAAVSAALGLLLLAFATTVDFPRAEQNFKGDEATYYSMGRSLASDFDFSFERKDLLRVWEEYRSGPEGIFLKRGKTVHIAPSDHAPFLSWVKQEDPVRTRLYYGKSYIYPLVASPFVAMFGTNGFLILHALLAALDLFIVYAFLVARGSSQGAALAFAAVFLGASVVPVYFIWLTPELFNFSLVLYALFFWSYKEMAAEGANGAPPGFLRGAGSDYLAAALIGVLTFSKPTHALLMFPLVALAAGRRQWRRGAMMVAVWAALTGGLFLGNVAITGEFNYQGGDRKTFYGNLTFFPFASEGRTFENLAPNHGREAVMVGDVLVNAHTLSVFRHNLVYIVFGRSGGLVPYFFPGVLSALLFLTNRHRQTWQWLAAATAAGGIVGMLLLWPFTFSGGGGPIGNRYFLSFYPLLLLLTPPLSTLGSTAVALAVGALFTAKLVLNPFHASFNPGEHLQSGALRWLPLELTLLNDLPVAANADRAKRPLGGTPPVLAYLPDDNAFNPEGDAFWVKGKTSAEVILRAPVADTGSNRFVTKIITRLGVEIQNGARPDRVTVSTGRDSRTLDLKPAEVARVSLAVDDGVPYRRDEQPTSYVYTVTITTTDGFVPFLEAPGSSDSRFLGARVRLIPEYADAEVTMWSAAPGAN